MKVHGIPVTVDNKGVHASEQTADAVGPATDGVNQVLAGFGMTLYVTRPTQTTKGAATTFDAGSLILDWFPPGAPGGIVFEFGGAHVTAAATLPFEALFEPTVGDVTGALGESLLAPSLDPSGGALSGTGVITPGGASLDIQPTSAPLNLPGGLNPWWVVVALAATLGAAFGLRMLPTRVLDAANAECETGEGM